MLLPDVDCDQAGEVMYNNGTCYLDGKQLGIWNYTVFKDITNQSRISASEEYYK